MPRPTPRPVLRACLLLLVWTCTDVAGQTPDLFDEIYARAQAQQHELRTLHARFTEITTSSLLNDPIVAKGTLVAEWPTRIRLDYDSPERRTVIVDERRFVMIAPARHERLDRDITAAQKRVRKYYVHKSPSELRKHFDVTATRDPKRQDAYRLVLVPKRKRVKEGLSELRLWLDARTLLLHRMEMRFPDGDSRTFTLEDARTNEPIAPGVFDAASPR